MHAIYFWAKRLHLMTNATGQRVLSRIAKVPDMTPARFDLMCLLRTPWILGHLGDPRRQKNGPGFYRSRAAMAQSGLICRLGLHPSTVSKMLKRLREMGWVRVERDYEDGRAKLVYATELGLRRIWQAMSRVFRGRLMASRFEHVHRGLRPSVHVFEALDETRDLLTDLARCFGDRSNVDYNYGTTVYRIEQPLG